MNIDKLNYKSLSNNRTNLDTALIFASYQPNKLSSDLLRTALESLNKININNASVWTFDIVFLHLGRGIMKSNEVHSNGEKFSVFDWINWYKKKF